MPNLRDLISKDEGIQELLGKLEGAFKGAARGLTTDTVGAPVDLVGGALGALGVPVGDAPVGGSKWLRGITNQPTEDTPAELVGNLLSALTSPGKAATDIASLAPMLGGILMGRKSNTWDKARADFFESMEQYVDPADMAKKQEFWQKIGVMRGPKDKKLRQEIPDQDSRLLVHGGETGRKPLSDVLDHPDLYEAYPDFAKAEVSLFPEHADNSNATFTAPFKLPKDPGYIDFNPNSATARQDLLHEIQHAVQRKEDFARGGSAGSMKGMPEYSRLKDEVAKAFTKKGHIAPSDYMIDHLLYKRLAGEAEARMVADRATWPKELLSILPETDIKPEQLIAKYYDPDFASQSNISWLGGIIDSISKPR